MSLFDQLGQQGSPRQIDPRQQQQAFQSDLNKLKKDPAAFVKAQGKNIPAGMNDPSQIAQYLINSGQVGNPRYQMVMQMMSRMGRR